MIPRLFKRQVQCTITIRTSQWRVEAGARIETVEQHRFNAAVGALLQTQQSLTLPILLHA